MHALVPAVQKGTERAWPALYCCWYGSIISGPCLPAETHQNVQQAVSYHLQVSVFMFLTSCNTGGGA